MAGMNADDERRAFIRHPVDVPIHIALQSSEELQHISMSDVGEGGVAFFTNVAFDDGMVLKITVPHVQPPFEAACVVCWRKISGEQFEVGVKFLDESSRFRARMVEQVCHIEGYRKQAAEQGRILSGEESAQEWIGKYAAHFGGR
ncbi:MAG: PilZ domain-containing protein [Mariprofundaceae bacterium]|nr:PilZ domain-containing protein [Mariprofundaceae bacterium]